jgi:hypothetical protein
MKRVQLQLGEKNGALRRQRVCPICFAFCIIVRCVDRASRRIQEIFFMIMCLFAGEEPDPALPAQWWLRMKSRIRLFLQAATNKEIQYQLQFYRELYFNLFAGCPSRSAACGRRASDRGRSCLPCTENIGLRAANHRSYDHAPCSMDARETELETGRPLARGSCTKFRKRKSAKSQERPRYGFTQEDARARLASTGPQSVRANTQDVYTGHALCMHYRDGSQSRFLAQNMLHPGLGRGLAVAHSPCQVCDPLQTPWHARA